MSGIILAPNEISDLSRSVRPVAEEGTPAWGTAADVLGKGFKRFMVEPDTVALWDFTRKLGNPLADLSPYGNDLTLNGAVVRVADGPFGWSYDFPGTASDYLMTSGNPASLQITGELTVEVIYKPEDVSWARMISKWDYGDANKSWVLGYDSTNLEHRISVDGTAEQTIELPVVVAPINRVSCMAITFKPSTYSRSFVNGCLVAEDTSAVQASLYNSDQNVVIGGYMDSDTLNEYFNGHIYMVRITPRSKSLEELWRAGGRLY